MKAFSLLLLEFCLEGVSSVSGCHIAMSQIKHINSREKGITSERKYSGSYLVIPWSYRNDISGILCVSLEFQKGILGGCHYSLVSLIKIRILAIVIFKSIISFQVLVLHLLIFLVLSSLNHSLPFSHLLSPVIQKQGEHNASDTILDFAPGGERTKISWHIWGTDKRVRDGN